jgi:hypothetical protein
MDGRVDDQDYNDGAHNDHPIGKLNARYRCPFAKPFHDYPPIFKQRLTKGETRRQVRDRGRRSPQNSSLNGEVSGAENLDDQSLAASEPRPR